jgi:hypothetical protein
MRLRAAAKPTKPRASVSAVEDSGMAAINVGEEYRKGSKYPKGNPELEKRTMERSSLKTHI